MTKKFIVGFALLFACLPLAMHAEGSGAPVRIIDPLGGLAPEAQPDSTKPPEAPSAPTKNPEAQPKPPTEITCETEMNFDEKTHLAIFIGNVHVKDPEFDLTCDKMTAFLAHEEKPAKPAPGASPKPTISGKTPGGKPATPKAKTTPAPSPKPGPKTAAGGADAKSDAPEEKGSGVERVLAEGHVIIIQDKVNPDTGEKKHYIGRASQADYDKKSGDIVLTGTEDPATWPQLQEGINTHIATEPGVKMIMNRVGNLRTIGHSKTVITEESDDKNKPKNTQ